MEASKEWREGYETCVQYYTADPNRNGTAPAPYSPGSQERTDWLQGWNTYWHPGWSKEVTS